MAKRNNAKNDYYSKRKYVLSQRRKEQNTFIPKVDLLNRLKNMDIPDDEKMRIAKMKKKEIQEILQNIEKNDAE